MTDNFKPIADLLEFSDNKQTFYYVQILRRKKENPDAKHVKLIKNFYIDSESKYWGLEDEIKNMCDYFNARAYIRLNRRAWENVAFKMFEYAGKYAQYQDFKSFRSVFSKACGNCHIEPNKLWVVDVDEENVYLVKSLIEKLHQDIQKDYSVKTILETKNGHHIITNPFNVQSFKYTFPEISIHKDNPTNLYTP